MKTGLYFGSFNPIHIGHVILANYLLEYSNLGEIWFIVSPQNPFKEKKSLLDSHHRLEMVRLALEPYPEMAANDIEFHLPQPSYTIDTLEFLTTKHPTRIFSLIMGEDNLASLHKWKRAEDILDKHEVVVYPRNFYEKNDDFPSIASHPNVHTISAPKLELSATMVREMIAQGKNFRPMLPPEVYNYLQGSHLYRS